MESYNVAVIGASAVGKSTLIQRVFTLPRPPISNASTVRQVVDNVPIMVTLLELDLAYHSSGGFCIDPLRRHR